MDKPDFRPALDGQTVYAVDAHSLIYQVFHALPDMRSPQDEPVGAVFGFARDLHYLLESKKPDYLFCAFDLPGKTFRHALYDRYKIARPAMPDNLIPQLPLVRQLIETLGVPALGVESYEADDVLATLARRAEALGARCLIVTADKDCRQLITERVAIYEIRKDRVYDRQTLETEWGIQPEQVVDYQSLVGDAVDGVPGVPLVGPKLARQLLQTYGTLENLFDHVEEVAGVKRKQNLIDHREQVMMNRRLVRLDTDVPVAIDWSAARTGRIDRAAASELFARLGIHRLAQKFDALAAPPENPPPPQQQRLF